jgi:phytanoyl-CoA hydroxylase
MALSPAQLKQYLEEGYVAVESLFDPQALAPLVGEFEAAIDTKARALYEQGQLKNLHEGAPFETRLALLCRDAEPEAAQELWRVGQGKHHKTAGMFAVWTQPALLDVVEQVIGPEILAHPQFNEREADDTFMVNFWIPLVDAPMETGALQVIPGSHRWDVLPHERIGIYDGLREESLPAHEVVDCPLQLGGALLIHSRTTHRSVANTTDIVRWSLDLRYCDWRQPTGRPDIPGFVARSAKHPEKVAQSVEDWLQLFADDTAGLDPHAR